MGSPSGARNVARVAVRGGVAVKRSMTRAATSKAPSPESRTTASAERPGGVASAAIGSESMADAGTSGLSLLPASGLPVGRGFGRRLDVHDLPRRPLLALAREQPL